MIGRLRQSGYFHSYREEYSNEFIPEAMRSYCGYGLDRLETQAKKSGKSNLEFRYFEGLDHSLGITAWFTRGVLPEGHKAIFEFIKTRTQPPQPQKE